MSDAKTPRVDALLADPLNSSDLNAWRSLAADLERMARAIDLDRGTLHTKLKSARLVRDEAIAAQHEKTIEAKVYHRSLMRCEADARRWQWVRKHVKRFWTAAAPAEPTQGFKTVRELDLAVDAAMYGVDSHRRPREEPTSEYAIGKKS